MAAPAKAQLQVITPAIMSLRMERLVNTINGDVEDSVQRAIRLCKVYVEEMTVKQVSIFSTEDVCMFGEELFQAELYLLMGFPHLALESITIVRSKVQNCLVKYAVMRKRLLENEQSEEFSGTLYHLPRDVRSIIGDKLFEEYCY